MTGRAVRPKGRARRSRAMWPCLTPGALSNTRLGLDGGMQRGPWPRISWTARSDVFIVKTEVLSD